MVLTYTEFRRLGVNSFESRKTTDSCDQLTLISLINPNAFYQHYFNNLDQIGRKFSNPFTLNQARRQNSVTGGAEINFGVAREVYLCEFERGTGARKIHPSLDQMNKVKTKDSEGFSGPNQVIAKKRSLSQERHAYYENTKISASICTPVAPSLLISSGHSPRLGETIFV